MRNPMSRVRKVMCLLGLLALILAGSATLTSSPASAFGPPIFLCGWSTLWDCTLPDGSVVTVGGTQCDIAEFEEETGATCVIKTF